MVFQRAVKIQVIAITSRWSWSQSQFNTKLYKGNMQFFLRSCCHVTQFLIELIHLVSLWLPYLPYSYQWTGNSSSAQGKRKKLVVIFRHI